MHFWKKLEYNIHRRTACGKEADNIRHYIGAGTKVISARAGQHKGKPGLGSDSPFR